MTFFKFARQHLVKDEVRPFMYGLVVAFVGLGSMLLSSDKEARAGERLLIHQNHVGCRQGCR